VLDLQATLQESISIFKRLALALERSVPHASIPLPEEQAVRAGGIVVGMPRRNYTDYRKTF
jgi:hypothetical protein